MQGQPQQIDYPKNTYLSPYWPRHYLDVTELIITSITITATVDASSINNYVPGSSQFTIYRSAHPEVTHDIAILELNVPLLLQSHWQFYPFRMLIDDTDQVGNLVYQIYGKQNPQPMVGISDQFSPSDLGDVVNETMNIATFKISDPDFNNYDIDVTFKIELLS